MNFFTSSSFYDIRYRKNSCISRTFLPKFLAQNHGCRLSTRPLHANWASDRMRWCGSTQIAHICILRIFCAILHIKLKNCSIKAAKQLFVREQFSTSRHSTCLLAMGLDTSHSSLQTSAWLLSYECFHEHNYYKMSFLDATFDVKTVMNEEIPVNEWQKKIKNVKVRRNDVYSIKF